ncbi:MAG: glycosyltransferase [Salibacteraceae bacterium]|nr:glycosyltransferase [Salibacteraceae bacterium]
MKIAIIGTSWPFRGGLAAYNERLAKAFVDAGHEVKIHTFSLQYPGFLFPGKTQLASWEKPADLNIVEDVNSVNPINWLITGNKIKNERPDLVVVKFWLPFMGPAFGTILRRIKSNGHTKVVSVLDNIIPHEVRFGDRPFTNYFTKPVDAFLSQSASVQEDLSQFDTAKPRTLNPHPLFDNFGARESVELARQRIGVPIEGIYFLFFGFIRDYKGLDLLVEAMSDSRLKASGAKVIVAGEFYSNEEKYLNLIKKHGVSDDIILKTEFIPDDQVAHFFNACDVVVQPYKDATQSGVTQIAYHFEKPMIVTNVGGLAEIVPHGKSGFVCEPNAKSLAETLVNVLQPGMVDQLTEGTKEEKKRFTWETMVESIFKLYHQVK